MEQVRKGFSMSGRKKTIIFDLDGTMYRGPQPIMEGIEAVRYCQKHDIPYIFMTNNSMRTREENVEHMEKMGYSGIHPEQFYNSAMASAAYARANYPGNKAWYVGRNGMKQALLDEGFEITDDQPDFVFVGLDKEAGYQTYSKALSMILNGAQLIGTNKDRILAKPGGFEVGNGSVVALFEYAADAKSPDIGKPARPILDLCLNHYGLKPDEVVLIGDNLETDIALGYNNQVETVFVQSGVHHEEDIDRLQVYPDHIVRDLSELDLSNLTAM